MRGGIERAFMSTTFDRAAALHYASQPGKPAIVFEMQMGMLDRGAELGWLSQARFTISPELLPISTELPTISPELPPISPELPQLTDCAAEGPARSLSQYPHERECLFAPLTSLEVQRTRVVGSVRQIAAPPPRHHHPRRLPPPPAAPSAAAARRASRRCSWSRRGSPSTPCNLP